MNKQDIQQLNEAYKAVVSNKTCRDCRYWKCLNPEALDSYPRSTKPDEIWVNGKCDRLKSGISINTLRGDSKAVTSVETDANFGCVYFEMK